MAHFAATEARFRRHLRQVDSGEGLIPLEDLLPLITQNDVVNRHVLDPTHRSYTPDFGVFIEVEDGKGGTRTMAISRQLVLFCVERRKSWRMLQSKAGVANLDYLAQREALASFDEDGVPMANRFVEIGERVEKALANLN